MTLTTLLLIGLFRPVLSTSLEESPALWKSHTDVFTTVDTDNGLTSTDAVPTV